MVGFLGILLLAWLVMCGFLLNVAMALHWIESGISPARLVRRGFRYGRESQAFLDQLEKEDEEDEKE